IMFPAASVTTALPSLLLIAEPGAGKGPGQESPPLLPKYQVVVCAIRHGARSKHQMNKALVFIKIILVQQRYYSILTLEFTSFDVRRRLFDSCDTCRNNCGTEMMKSVIVLG